MDRWFNIDGRLIKNPDENTIKSVKEYQIVEYVQGTEGVITEQWWVNVESKAVINFSYSADTPKGLISIERREYFKKCGVSPAFDRKYILPPSYFTENGIRLPH